MLEISTQSYLARIFHLTNKSDGNSRNIRPCSVLTLNLLYATIVRPLNMFERILKPFASQEIVIFRFKIFTQSMQHERHRIVTMQSIYIVVLSTKTSLYTIQWHVSAFNCIVVSCKAIIYLAFEASGCDTLNNTISLNCRLDSYSRRPKLQENLVLPIPKGMGYLSCPYASNNSPFRQMSIILMFQPPEKLLSNVDPLNHPPLSPNYRYGCPIVSKQCWPLSKAMTNVLLHARNEGLIVMSAPFPLTRTWQFVTYKRSI